MINRLMRGAPVLLFAGLLACSGDARSTEDQPDTSSQLSSREGRDLETLSTYELTMEDLHKWARANTAVSAITRQRPDLEEQMAINPEEASIDGLADKLNNVPDVRDAIQSNGLSARQFTVITFTVMQVAMAQMALQQGVPADSFAARAGINPGNLDFYEANRVEIDQLMQQLQSAGRRP